MEIRQSNAERYRIEAARIRHRAVRTASETVRLQLLEIARQYERLATVAEQLPQRERPIGPLPGYRPPTNRA
jgi:hypothetical protein